MIAILQSLVREIMFLKLSTKLTIMTRNVKSCQDDDDSYKSSSDLKKLNVIYNREAKVDQSHQFFHISEFSI